MKRKNVRKIGNEKPRPVDEIKVKIFKDGKSKIKTISNASIHPTKIGNVLIDNDRNVVCDSNAEVLSLKEYTQNTGA